MAYAMFRCCVTANHLPEFDRSTDALLSKLGVRAGEIPEFGCCGYPLKNIDMIASLAAAARNLALAEREGKSILTSCACCHGTLLHSARLLRDEDLRAKVNESLAGEGLSYGGSVEVRHLIHVLVEDVGVARITNEAKATPAFLNVAIQYGCKLIRPNMSTSLGPSAEPFFEQLVAAAGAAAVPWGLEKDCCGSGINNTDRALADLISREKVSVAGKEGADGIVAACPFCVLQLRKAAPDDGGLPVMSVAQMLCQALDLDDGVKIGGC